ncbi:MAG: PD40 domain-containing protein [Bryobacteraceae bacterium]|nr:PD40 domain-containing protein [Bryobacteraceae bacterium]
MPLRRLIRFACLTCVLAAAPLAAQTKLLRFPDVHAGKVVFSYAGDLWTAPASGGAAVRLTAHPGQELFARFSPDGKWIAFTGQYDGDEQVYVVPASGGSPRQLTYYPAKGPLPARWGYDNLVYGWTPDGKYVVFRSLRESWSVASGRLYRVPVEGGLAEPLPMPTSGAADFSPDGKKIVYSPLFRDFRTWKRYQGGWAQNLYVFDLETKAAELIASSPRTEREPMWIGNRIYFASDRTGTLNLYEYDLASKKVRPVTTYKDWDVRWPSASPDGEIVFELNGELHLLDVRKAGQPRRIPITVPSDAVAARPAQIEVGRQIQDFDISPKGERALFTARGDIFTAPIEKGNPRNLTRSSNAHDHAPSWSPDGRLIAFVSDLSGEDEIYTVPQDGSAAPSPVTSGNKAKLYNPRWSPDSKRIAYSDKDGKLFVVTLADKSVAQAAAERRGRIRDYVWSPDSGYLAYSLTGESNTSSIWIWSAAENRARRVTQEMFVENTPAWDPEGNYLYYLSEREFAPMLSDAEWNFATGRSAGIYALALRTDVKHPFPPPSDEVTVGEQKKEDEKKEEAKKEEAKKEGNWIRIDFNGIEDRVARAPIAADNINSLAAIKGHLLFTRRGTPYYGREPDRRPTLILYELKERKETTLAENITGWAWSEDGGKVLVRQDSGFTLMDAKPNAAQSKKTVSTAGMLYDRQPSQEWNQIFGEVWRRYRDFFYVANMHGYDWEALRNKYAPQLEYVGHRPDLNYVIGEMISELNVGHAYITGGDYDVPARPSVALLGAHFALDAASGRYRIDEVLRGHNEEPKYRSPATEVGVNLQPGEYVLAIDGEDLAAPENPYKLLRGKANRAVKLTVNSRPSADGAREVTLSPIADETQLHYLEMTLDRRARVEKATNGQVGYMHLPNMGAEGIYEFIKWYYPQTRKAGLIIDDRGNGGGNVSRMLIERLRREVLATTFARTIDETGTYPDAVAIGHKVVLLDENSASDGDLFPAMFRQAGLGPLIGKRSWGGVIGITGHGPLLDGGDVFVPQFGHASPEGQWIIEGHGVDPDIVVEQEPQAVIEGRDPQLERAIEEVMKRIQQNPPRLPGRPADPVRTE